MMRDTERLPETQYGWHAQRALVVRLGVLTELRQVAKQLSKGGSQVELKEVLADVTPESYTAIMRWGFNDERDLSNGIVVAVLPEGKVAPRVTADEGFVGVVESSESISEFWESAIKSAKDQAVPFLDFGRDYEHNFRPIGF